MLQADLGLSTSGSFEEDLGGRHFVWFLLGISREGWSRDEKCGYRTFDSRKREKKRRTRGKDWFYHIQSTIEEFSILSGV